MVFTKRAHQSAKFQTFVWSDGISPNQYFDRLLFLKECKISAKKVQRNYISWYFRVMQNLKKSRFVLSKMRRIWWILIWALKSLHLDWSLSCKVNSVWPKRYRGVIFHDTEEPCQIRRKMDLRFEKWHVRNLEKFHHNTVRIVKSVKIGTFMESFCPKYKMHELKVYRGVMCNDTEELGKIWRGIDLSFQNWHNEFLTDFDSSTWKSQNFTP